MKLNKHVEACDYNDLWNETKPTLFYNMKIIHEWPIY